MTVLRSGTAAAALGLLLVAAAPAVRDPVRVEALAHVFEPGGFLSDRNQDGVIDAISARLVLPDSPSADEVAAATAVAARLGFETSALSFPLVFRASEVPRSSSGALVVFGASNPLLPRKIKARIEVLSEGQGVAAFADGVLAFAGKTPSGTRVAAEAFAARSPYLWEVIGRDAGETYENVGRDLAAVLAVRGVDVSTIHVDEAVFEKNRLEVVALTYRARVSDGGRTRAKEALAALVDRHARGVDTEKLTASGAHELRIRLEDRSGSDTVTIPRVGVPLRILTPPRDRPPPPPEAGDSTERRETTKRFDLSTLFTRTGLLEDSDRDQIPDGTEALLVLPSGDEPMSARGAAHLAARLGLESTGVSFPIAKLDSEIKDEKDERASLVLLGKGRQARELERLGKTRSSSSDPRTGVIEVVPGAFGDASAVVVTGSDAVGLEAASDYLAAHLPYVWTAKRGSPTLDDVEDELSALLEGRTAPGQAGLALARLDEIAAGLEGKDVEQIDARVFLEQASPDFDRFASSELTRLFPSARVSVRSQGRRDPVEVFREEPTLEWEVDAFWKVFREKVEPKIEPGSPVSVEIRVSEAPELRQSLEREIRSRIERAGGKPGSVSVLSAYKQGLSWLTEKIAPALTRLPRDSVSALEISWAPFPVDATQKWRFYGEPARWLNELYPVDDLLARDLGFPLSAISFVRSESAGPGPRSLGEGGATYVVTARKADGTTLLRETFSPSTYERAYLDAFPDRARVTVTTGWVRASVGRDTIVDERVATDLDRIWDHYQGSTLTKVYDHVKRTTSGKPTQDKQPFFHTLRFELEASEPDYALGLEQELVSSLESIHDDVYFDTLDFFTEAIEDAEGKPIAARSGAPGTILPWIHPERRGAPPRLVVSYSENASRQPKLAVDYQLKNGEKKSETRELAPVKLPRPTADGAVVRAGQDGLSRLELRVALEKAEGEAGVGQTRRILDLLDNLARLQRASVFPHALGFSGLAEMVVRVDAPGTSVSRAFASRPAKDDTPLAPRYTGRLVNWDHVISPDESERIAASLGTLPGVRAYVAGRSYQGRPVSVMEVGLPVEADWISQAKASAWKPVLSIMGRQHANEVSSTSHILRLAELLATDPSYRRYLEKMNVVIQPVVNPDGAALAYELQKLTPLHCLHAGRYSALGPDVPTEARKPDTLLTEALVLNRVYNTWLPDVQLNPHGYPTHEWVQTFANYNPNGFRSYWIPRGWWTSISPVEDPRYPFHREAALSLRDRIAREVSRDPEVRATNGRIQDRYRRWTTRFQPHAYDLEIHEDTAIYFTRRSAAAPRTDPRAGTTVFFGMTEAMDETAQGPALDLAARMGFSYLMASLGFLADADYTLYRLEEERQGKIRLSLTRPRPVKSKPSAKGNDR